MFSALLIDMTQQRMSTNTDHILPAERVDNGSPSATPKPLMNATHWFPKVIEITPSPSATATTSLPPITTVTPQPTFTPAPTTVPQASSASFVPLGDTFMHNVIVALNANNGALRHVVVPPRETFSFVANLGAQPHWLPWENVYIQSTADTTELTEDLYAVAPLFVPRWQDVSDLTLPEADADNLSYAQAITITRSPIDIPRLQPTLSIAPPAGPNTNDDMLPEENAPPPPTAIPEPEEEIPPTATSGPISVPVLGGGVCDLASRYVVAARPLLPESAFQFKPHPNGLSNIDDRDAVSIWFEGQPTDLDLLITNTTDRWLIFSADITGGSVTITATLQDQP